MVFNINTFRSQGLVEGGARPSMFEVIFPNISNLNTVLPVLVQSNTDRLSVSCTAASLPAFRVDAVPVYYFGRPIYFNGERTFDPWVVTILNDEDFALRDFFEAWSNQTNQLVGNIQESSDPNDYKVDGVTVRQWGKAGNLIREYEFAGMWPAIVGDIALSWDQGNRIETFDVRFVYDWFKPVKQGNADQPLAAPPTYDVGDPSENSLPGFVNG